MRISDWSSDVCSSDLVSARAGNQTGNRVAVLRLQSHDARRRPAAGKSGAGARPSPRALFHRTLPGFEGERPAGAAVHHQAIAGPGAARPAGTRSEEHTSELQSLMRISYAVFCLKKKKQTKK